MDPRYQWPPQGYPNGQYIPPVQPNGQSNGQSNGYHANGYGAQYPQQPISPLAQGYPSSQPGQSHPRVVIPPRSQQYIPIGNNGAQPRQGYSHGMPQMQNPRIRQVQVPVQRTGPQGGHVADRNSAAHGQPRPQQQTQTPMSKPVQKLQSHQENFHQSQHRTPSQPYTNQNQPRAPLQPQVAQKNRTPSSQSATTEQRSPSLQHTPSSQGKAHPKVVIKKPSHSPSLHTPTKPHHAPAKALPADLTLLLLSAADEYINAARRMGSLAAMSQGQADLDQYYKLMATGLGCMEAVLKKYNQAPRDEAKLRLRYASLLVEETENSTEIEEVLSRGIALCKRSRLTDIMYSMLHLQARYQFKSNHRAALKSLDGPIAETETFEHIVWVYAFRFLKASLALQTPGRPETASALQQLHAISNHAEKRGDRAISVTASALEAMIHLRGPVTDHLEHAQRAIAAARSHQLQTSVKQLGQVAALIDSIDIACSLQKGIPDVQKMTALQQKADNDPGPSDGIFSVLIEKSFGGNLTFSTGGVFKKAEDGRDELVFSWLPKSDLQMLAYYLSGMTSLPHDKGLNYLQEGFKLTQESLQRQSSYRVSLPAAMSQRHWITMLDWQVKFTLGLAACRWDDVQHARKILASLQSRLKHAPFNKAEQFSRHVSYLSGVADQMDGSFDSAMATWVLSVFDLPGDSALLTTKTEIAIMAMMNRLLILRDPSHPDHYLAGIFFSQLESLCGNHHNAQIDCAFRILRALLTPGDSIIRQKTLISNALSTSQNLKNTQLMTLALNYMTSRFFANAIDQQAIKSVRAARSVAKSSRSVLWRAVAFGLCINTFQRNGLWEDAKACQRAFEELQDKMPERLKAVTTISGGDDGVGQQSLLF